VILQEATSASSVSRIATLAEMPHSQSRPGKSLAYVSRVPVALAQWMQPRVSRHAFLEIAFADNPLRVFGLHLSAVHAAWTERRRTRELAALLTSIDKHQHGPHILLGDFNTLAPGEWLDTARLPHRLRAMVWLSGGRIRFRTIQHILDAGYTDCFRALHPDDPGQTFPTWGVHVRLDFAFVPARQRGLVTDCRVLRSPSAAIASDHFPLLVETAATY
jgi:endonuclease/exonuclease/phosphatase family metal-dependent hydrolase